MPVLNLSLAQSYAVLLPPSTPLLQSLSTTDTLSMLEGLKLYNGRELYHHLYDHANFYPNYIIVFILPNLPHHYFDNAFNFTGSLPELRQLLQLSTSRWTIPSDGVVQQAELLSRYELAPIPIVNFLQFFAKHTAIKLILPFDSVNYIYLTYDRPDLYSGDRYIN